MAGGGSETQTTSVEIPQWLQEAAQRNLSRADQVSQIGYTPYYGPDVAAMTPMQIAAMQNTGAAASAFGLPTVADPMAGMPTPQTFAGGVQGYSSAPLFQQSLEALRVNAPGQYAAIQSLFVDPRTGAAPFGITSMPMGGMAPQSYGQPMREGPPQGSGASRNYGSTAADRIAQGLGGSTAASRIASSNLASRLPGGVNTRNPTSAVNQAAARLTSKPQKAPTSASRPAAKSTSTSKSVSDSRSKAGKK
jgi:hypothetical protein